MTKRFRAMENFLRIAADLRTISEKRGCSLGLSVGTFHVKRRQRERIGMEIVEGR